MQVVSGERKDRAFKSYITRKISEDIVRHGPTVGDLLSFLSCSLLPGFSLICTCCWTCQPDNLVHQWFTKLKSTSAQKHTWFWRGKFNRVEKKTGGIVPKSSLSSNFPQSVVWPQNQHILWWEAPIWVQSYSTLHLTQKKRFCLDFFRSFPHTLMYVCICIQNTHACIYTQYIRI